MKKLIFSFLIISIAISCKSPEARYPVSQNSGSYINESVARNKKLLAQEESLIKGIIAEDSSTNYIASNNGFWYFYNKKVADSVSTQKPEFGDIVSFDYHIKTLDDQTIYAEGEKPTKEYAIDQENLFSGLRNGLKLMKAGETVTFLFPSYKAFGYYGDKDRIGTNIPIKTTVTLHSIQEIDSIN
ncbi:gliding motility-associated peptidyl-prolyl isomerase GldI [Zunongwangia sp. SCSIO 43204]|uniref:gliding motility-associated peptidyl-prolyl isomerase GldI n=1 Tax=Zunongwangia sp. SCSIO 43204 TaxID=2779359 RepID=UPI001CA7D05F|nr:gliding motility-associated peptidyl-prolyl isomerase GldI [Zunongwangia sp. SCSIO 43204]UAB82786.1 gliding motility-associated peptidyl-prolyl isomerase GldI [Zunongwangia sp. SCSIO 43204]